MLGRANSTTRLSRTAMNRASDVRTNVQTGLSGRSPVGASGCGSGCPGGEAGCGLYLTTAVWNAVWATVRPPAPAASARRSSSTARPTRISSAGPTSVGAAIRTPLTHVPFRDPRSSTTIPSGVTLTRAWSLDTSGSSGSGKSAPGSRPISSGFVRRACVRPPPSATTSRTYSSVACSSRTSIVVSPTTIRSPAFASAGPGMRVPFT